MLTGIQVAHMQGLLKLHLDKILFRSLDKEMQRYLAFSKLQSDMRIKKGDKVPIKDVFSFLIDARDPETGILMITYSGMTRPLLRQSHRIRIRNARIDRRSQPAYYWRYLPLLPPLPPKKQMEAMH